MASYPAYASHSPPSYPPSSNTHGSSFEAVKTADNGRNISRTPSPTPSEDRELRTAGAFDWQRLMQWRFWIRREWLWYYVAFIIITVITVLVSVFHKQIVHFLRPAADWMYNLPAGFLIPIAVLFIISFPPLFGHEIIAVLCGLVWGLWVGFGIVAAGTFLGEVGNFYAFKYCCRARGEKLERSNITYGCLAKVVRDGGFKIALIARLSAIPGHFTTAVFSTCGMGIVVFSIAAILSLPKQFITVYLGVVLEESETGGQNSTTKIISNVVLVVTFLITVLAMWYIYHQMGKVKVEVIHDRRKARQTKISRADFAPYDNPNALDSSSSVVFNPNISETDIPLAPSSGRAGDAGPTSPYQQWNKEGRAVGYTGDPQLYAPHPQRRTTKPFVGRYNDDEDYDIEGSRQSTELVGWDMRPGGDGNHNINSSPNPPQLPQPRFISPPPEIIGGVGGVGGGGGGGGRFPDPFESVETVHEIGYAPRRTSTLSPAPPRTPTQAQYVQYVPANLPSPYDQHQGQGHGVEATDATYATAHSRLDTDAETDDDDGVLLSPSKTKMTTTAAAGAAALPRTAYSPPPPRSDSLR